MSVVTQYLERQGSALEVLPRSAGLHVRLVLVGHVSSRAFAAGTTSRRLRSRSLDGYLDEPDVIAPSVITLNATAASHATNDFLVGARSPRGSRSVPTRSRPWPLTCINGLVAASAVTLRPCRCRPSRAV